ncbi:MAG TPA: SAM-dependent methyltransferase, partial [bacterium]|nr:SAM-dependent methyltransferase [bacterium]
HTKLVSYYQGRENEREDALVATLKGGESVALISEAGTPCISDPGFRLVRRAVEEGLRVEPIPGASAALAALSAAGLPTDRFTFVGFLGDKPGKRRKALEELRAVTHTLVFYLSKWKAATHLRDCLEILGDRRACLCRELTKIHEEFRRGTLSELLVSVEEGPLKGEIVLLVEGME